MTDISLVPADVKAMAANVDCPECWPDTIIREVELDLYEIDVIHGPQCNEPSTVIYA